MAVFLIVIGVTGSIIVFNPELNAWLDPPPKVAVRADAMLDVYELRDRVMYLVPHGLVNFLPLQVKPGDPFTAGITPRIDPATGKPYELEVDTIALDPYTGDELKRGKSSEGLWPITAKNFVDLVNRLHYQLAIPGNFGSWLFGCVALLWTIDCFVSGYLTLPISVRRMQNSNGNVPASREPPTKGWWQRWKPAWRVRWRGSAYHINFDLHRAGGLWVWVLLFVLAWTGVGFNLGEQIYQPVMKGLFGTPDPYGELPEAPDKHVEPPMDFRKARDRARQLTAEQAQIEGFEVIREESFGYEPVKNVYFYAVHTNRDLVEEGGSTLLLMNATTGAFAGISLPTGQNFGATLNSWMFALHTAAIWGLPYRIFVAMLGLLVTVLSATGIYIWWKKRTARQVSRNSRTRFDNDVIA